MAKAEDFIVRFQFDHVGNNSINDDGLNKLASR